MKNRKLISITLAMLLILSLCVPALAAEEDTLTRGELVSALFDLSGVTDMEPKQAYFEDVEMHGDLALAVRWAVGEGIITGYGDGRFGPDDPVTREQMAAMLYRNAKLYGQGFQGMWYFPLDYPDAGPYAWEPDTEYTDYQWWLALTEKGEWEIVSFGY